MKAKIHSVRVGGSTVFVWAQTKQGAIRDALEHLKIDADATIATGEQLYDAGQRGIAIHGADKYARMADPNQQELPGVTAPAQE